MRKGLRADALPLYCMNIQSVSTMPSAAAEDAHAGPPGLLEALRRQVRYLHYSLRTEEAYVHWVRAFVRFHDLRHPSELAGPEVEAFLRWLANERSVAPATHRQALSALLFLYEKVLRQPVDAPLPDLGRTQLRPLGMTAGRAMHARGVLRIGAHPLQQHALAATAPTRFGLTARFAAAAVTGAAAFGP